MSQLTTHVLDTSRGRPAEGVFVELRSGDVLLATASTDADGRVAELGADRLDDGVYALRFDTAAYFDEQGAQAGSYFDPEVVVTFAISGADHYHVPLLLSPFGYSTYRGS
jgi:5-hydroxyisourate hydrolase